MQQPKLRFKEFTQEIKQQKLANCIEEFDGYETLTSGYPLMTSARTGLMYQSDFRAAKSTESETTKFSLLPVGYCTYRHMSDDDIFHFNINDFETPGLVSQEYPVFNTKEGYDLKYIVEYLNSSLSFRAFCRQQKLGGTRTRLYFKNLVKFNICTPSLEEQKKITSLLSAVDKTIAILEEDLELWEEKKKGVIQKLLTREKRFTSPTNQYPDWTTIPLKDILTEYHEKSPKGASYEHVSLTREGVVPKSERYDRDFLVTTDEKQYRVTHINDICYNPANLKFGVICRNKYKDAIFSPIYVTYKVNNGFSPEFIEIIVTRNDFINYALKYQQGTVYERMSVASSDLLSIEVDVPCYEEQVDIANCISKLNDIVTIKQQKIECWKNIKAGLLQQLFV